MRKEKCVKTDNKSIGNRIKYYRQQKQFTQEEFAEAIGVSPGHVSRMERGIKRASLETLVEISRTLDVTLDALVGIRSQKEIECVMELSELLVWCNEYDREVILDTIEAMKGSMIRNRNIIKKG